jgi:exopolysaccharide biosynthesis polyprenyl glycosylphosphotransferase
MRRTTRYIVHTPFVAFGDILLINFGLIVALSIRAHELRSLDENAYACLRIAPLASVAALTILYVSDLYSKWLHRPKTDLVYSIAAGSAMLTLVIMALSFWERLFAFPRSVLALSSVIQFGLLLVFRLSIRAIYRASTGPLRALLIADDQATVVRVRSHLTEARQDWLEVQGWMLSTELNLLPKAAADCDVVLVLSEVNRKSQIVSICAQLAKDVLVVPEVFELSMIGAKPLQIGDMLIFDVRPPQPTPGQRLSKRIVDIVGSAVLLILTAPLMALTAIFVKFTSDGPVIFSQDRVGRRGREYTLFKFRTMVEDAERNSGPVLATQNDPRITPIGRLLRATRIDELPQLFNVLCGDMSLVGPRPERKHFVRKFSKEVPGYQFRLYVKPGVTGLAQVYGNYSSSAEQKLRFDLMYIYDYSLVMDIKILIKTILVVLRPYQASGVVNNPDTMVPIEEVQEAISSSSFD